MCPTLPPRPTPMFNCSTHHKKSHHLIATCKDSYFPGPVENTSCSFNGKPFQSCTFQSHSSSAHYYTFTANTCHYILQGHSAKHLFLYKHYKPLERLAKYSNSVLHRHTQKGASCFPMTNNFNLLCIPFYFYYPPNCPQILS